MLESFSSFVKRALFVNVPVAIAAIGNHDQAVVVFRYLYRRLLFGSSCGIRLALRVRENGFGDRAESCRFRLLVCVGGRRGNVYVRLRGISGSCLS